MSLMNLYWHPSASEDLKEIILYCDVNFGRRVANRVKDGIIYNAEMLCSFPKMGMDETTFKGLTSLEYRSIVVNSHTKIIYSIHNSYIYIHLLWNVRKSEAYIGYELAKRYQPQQQSTPSVLREPNAEDE